METSPITFLGVKIEIWALIMSVIAIIFTLFKDFILPLFQKPKIEIKYIEDRPFRRDNVNINRIPGLLGCFFRFSVKNIGNRIAENCRSQILTVTQDNINIGDYQGFPLRWASRPEGVINPAGAERLNISIGETEFIDLVVTMNNNPNIHLQKYHNVDIGINDQIAPGEYLITLIFSGDNFKPYIPIFRIIKPNTNNPNDTTVELVRVQR